MVGVAKKNYELSRKRILEGRSVLKGLLDSEALDNEVGIGKLYCVLLELEFLDKVAAGTIYAPNVKAVITAVNSRWLDAKADRKERNRRTFENRVAAAGGGLLARYVVRKQARCRHRP